MEPSNTFFTTMGAGDASPQTFSPAAETVAPTAEETFALLIAAQQAVSQAPPALQPRLALLTNYAQRVSGGDGAALELREDDAMVYYAASGSLAPFHGLRLPVAGSLSGRCVMEGRLLYCENSETDDRVDRAACRKVGAVSMLALPLLHNGAVIGVLKTTAKQPCAFSEQNIASLQVMGSIIIAAMSGVAEFEAKTAQTMAENRLRLAAQSANVGIWRWEIEANAIFWSDETYALMDTPPDTEITFERYLELVHPDDHAGLQMAVSNALENRTPYAIELRALQSDGSYRWIGGRGRGVYSAEGKPVALEGVVIDISERKRLEEALRRAAREAQEIGNAMPQIVWTARPDGRVDWRNDRWYEYTGMPSGEGGDLGWEPALHPDDASAYYASWHGCVRAEQPFTLEMRLREGAIGLYRWHLCRALPVREENGAIRKWFGTGTDIDDLKQARAAQQATEQRLLALADHAPAIIFIKDLEGRYLLVSRQFELLCGMNRAAILGKADADLFPEENANAARARDRAVLESNTPQIYEESGTLNGISRTFFAVKFPLHDAAGNIYAVGGISTDITERKRDQAEIVALNQRLRRAMAETQDRVKNNLQTIVAMLDIQTLNSDAPPEIADLQRLSGQIRALAAVHDILTEESKADGLGENVSSALLLNKLLAMLKQAAVPRPIHAQIADVRLSARQGNSLALLVNELFSNALRYGQSEMRVSFRMDSAEAATLEVSDDGPGFPPDFHPLKAANIGLELVENMARQDLGGETRYANRPEGGGQVIVTFPLQERDYRQARF